MRGSSTRTPSPATIMLAAATVVLLGIAVFADGGVWAYTAAILLALAAFRTLTANRRM